MRCFAWLTYQALAPLTCCPAITGVLNVHAWNVRRLDLLHLQCRAWTGRVAAVMYVPLMGISIVSWDDRVNGQSLRHIFKIISRFYDDLDPLSAHPHGQLIHHFYIVHSTTCMIFFTST